MRKSILIRELSLTKTPFLVIALLKFQGAEELKKNFCYKYVASAMRGLCSSDDGCKRVKHD